MPPPLVVYKAVLDSGLYVQFELRKTENENNWKSSKRGVCLSLWPTPPPQLAVWLIKIRVNVGHRIQPAGGCGGHPVTLFCALHGPRIPPLAALTWPSKGARPVALPLLLPCSDSGKRWQSCCPRAFVSLIHLSSHCPSSRGIIS